MRRAVAVLLALCVGLLGPVSAPGIRGSVALAQDSSDPPALGTVVLQDPLTGTGPFRPRACATGKGGSEFVEQGFRFRVTGRCTETSAIAVVAAGAQGVSAGNGELAVDVKMTEGQERGWASFSFRDQGNGDAYFLYWVPSLTRIELQKSIGSVSARLAENSHLAELEPDAWTRLAVRFAGPKIWVFVNDQLVLTATDPSLSRGALSIGGGRIGNIEDDAPVEIVWRNVQLTALATEPSAGAAPLTPAPASGAQQAGSAAPANAAPSASSAPPSGPPPNVGEVVYQDTLTAPGIIPMGSCPTGKGHGEVAGEGFLMVVSGKCTAQSRGAGVGPDLPGLTVPDGEIRVELKVTSGFDRSYITLVTRIRTTPRGGYGVSIAPGSGNGVLLWLGQDAAPPLARRTDLAGLFHRDEWNTLAVRLAGSSIWLIVNDQPVFMVDDSVVDTGAVSLGIGRSGNLDDDDEVAVVFRNFSVSKIEGAPEDRAPSYHRPSAPSDRGTTLSLAR
jgi:hypothetical protein